jgi:hypothetical protein
MHLALPVIIVALACFFQSCSRRESPSVSHKNITATSLHNQKMGLTEVQAVEWAERFIAQNGYTDLPHDRDHITHEAVEWKSELNQLLKMRHDTLERKAFGISRGRKGGQPGWTVVFRYRNPSHGEMNKTARAITMNRDGSDMRVEHIDFILAFIDKTL